MLVGGDKSRIFPGFIPGSVYRECYLCLERKVIKAFLRKTFLSENIKAKLTFGFLKGKKLLRLCNLPKSPDTIFNIYFLSLYVLCVTNIGMHYLFLDINK